MTVYDRLAAAKKAHDDATAALNAAHDQRPKDWDECFRLSREQQDALFAYLKVEGEALDEDTA